MIVIGYTEDQFGRAALDHGIEEARLRNTDLLVINSTAGDAYADPAFAQADQVRDLRARLTTSGIAFELSQPVGVDAATELLSAMDRPDAQVLVIGIKHRSPVGKLLLGERVSTTAAGVSKASVGGQTCRMTSPGVRDR